MMSKIKAGRKRRLGKNTKELRLWKTNTGIYKREMMPKESLNKQKRRVGNDFERRFWRTMYKTKRSSGIL